MQEARVRVAEGQCKTRNVNTTTPVFKHSTNMQQASAHAVSQQQKEHMPLPIEEHRQEILEAVKANTVTCIHGETGCGKSTGVPRFLLEESERADSSMRRGLGQPVKILMTLPRRMAAKKLAIFLAESMGVRCGGKVGYRIGKEPCSSDETKLLFVTVGYCLHYFTNNFQELQTYTHVILDEVCIYVHRPCLLYGSFALSFFIRAF
jgi:HrpA-like RNA helicase